ncbi:MAG: anthranilate synthase component II [Brotaphodocola sp.]
MILLIDNYDSFSYNLYQLVGEIVMNTHGSDTETAVRTSHDSEPPIRVIRNDEMTIEEIRSLHPDCIILSPGPGRPEDAGIIVDAAKILGKEIPILGVCLGHQAICAAFGATVTYARQLMHGKQSEVLFDLDSPLFRECPKSAPVARYHSLAADPATIPDCLKVIAKTTDGEVMAVQHTEFPIYGVQFHPESIMTPDGKQMLKNFIEIENKNQEDYYD